MNKKLLFIFNPRSGRQTLKNSLFDIIDTFTKGGYDVTVRPMQAPGDAYEMIRNTIHDFDTIVVSGVDGTLNEGVRGIMSFPKEERKALGYIPTGTTNDFAQSRGIPVDPVKAAENIVKNRCFEGDIGVFNGNRYFNYVAACGAFTDVSYDTPQSSKNIFGHMAYLFEGLKRITNLESFHVNLKCKEAEVDDDFFLLLVMNSTRMGGFSIDGMIDVDLSDGLFEIVLVKLPLNIIQIQEIFMAITNGQEDSNKFKLIRTSCAEIKFDEEIKWTLDGEYGGAYDRVSIDVYNKAMKYIG